MNFSHKFFIILIFLLFSFSCTPPSDYREFPQQSPLLKKEKFYIDPLIFYDSDSLKTRLDMYIEVPIENILYKKNINSGKYESKITLTINITNLNNENILAKTHNEYSAYSGEEMMKKSKESQYYFYNYFVEPGNYKIEIKIKDSNSKNEYKKSIDLFVKDFKSQEITFSDLMILSKYKINKDGTKEITPLINNNIFGLKEFFVFFEIYNENDNDITKEYVYKLKDNKDITIKEDVLIYSFTPFKNQKVENIFIVKELKKYLPEESDFDFYLFDNEKNIFFELEIIDKSSNEIVASKKLSFLPKRLIPEMQNKPRMH
ncbi:MAG: hypothetical protein NTU73_00190 [Ignavibacteriae bacterium]|nr:hypothetical protein [Ignavibacteriota bacterium]